MARDDAPGRGYLQRVIADGARPFRYRRGVRSLLGLPDAEAGGTARISAPMSATSMSGAGFAYRRERMPDESSDDQAGRVGRLSQSDASDAGAADVRPVRHRQERATFPQSAAARQDVIIPGVTVSPAPRASAESTTVSRRAEASHASSSGARREDDGQPASASPSWSAAPSTETAPLVKAAATPFVALPRSVSAQPLSRESAEPTFTAMARSPQDMPSPGPNTTPTTTATAKNAGAGEGVRRVRHLEEGEPAAMPAQLPTSSPQEIAFEPSTLPSWRRLPAERTVTPAARRDDARATTSEDEPIDRSGDGLEDRTASAAPLSRTSKPFVDLAPEPMASAPRSLPTAPPGSPVTATAARAKAPAAASAPSFMPAAVVPAGNAADMHPNFPALAARERRSAAQTASTFDDAVPQPAPAAPPPARVVVVREAAAAESAPSFAFWERRHLTHLRLRVLR